MSGSGGAVKGTLNADKTVWTSTDKLGFGARYAVSAVATNANGQKTTEDQRVHHGERVHAPSSRPSPR